MSLHSETGMCQNVEAAYLHSYPSLTPVLPQSYPSLTPLLPYSYPSLTPLYPTLTPVLAQFYPQSVTWAKAMGSGFPNTQVLPADYSPVLVLLMRKHHFPTQPL